MALPIITGEFRLVADPELRFTPAGKAVCQVRLVASKRKNQGTRENPDWVDDKTLWLSGSVWEQVAENVAESLQKGDLVEVRGAPFTREWDDREGNKRTSVELQIYAIAPSLQQATAKVTKVSRSSGSDGGQSGGGWGPSASTSQGDDPWSTTPSTPQDAPPEEPPF